jgi:hypothetical protein
LSARMAAVWTFIRDHPWCKELGYKEKCIGL